MATIWAGRRHSSRHYLSLTITNDDSLLSRRSLIALRWQHEKKTAIASASHEKIYRCASQALLAGKLVTAAYQKFCTKSRSVDYDEFDREVRFMLFTFFIALQHIMLDLT